MNRVTTITAPLLALSLAFLAGCTGLQSSVKDALDYGRGPFDQSPAAGSEAALEGLHESSWGNSGKWGARAPVTDENGDGDQAESDPPKSDPPV